MSGSIAGGIGLILTALILAAITIPFSIYYIKVSEEYKDDNCQKNLSTPDLSLWLKVVGWTYVSICSFCVPLLIVSGCVMCRSKTAGLVAGIPFCVLAIVGIFLFVWNIFGMVRLAQADDCHQHASYLWKWMFFAVLWMTGPVLWISVGSGSTAGKLMPSSDDD